VAWRDLPAGWHTVSSHCTGDRDFVVTLDDLRQSLFIASDELHLLPRTVGSGSLLVGVVGTWAGSETLADTSARIVTVERRFFAGAGPPFFLVSLIPLPGRRCSSTGGTGFYHAFALFLSQPCRLAGESDPWLAMLMAHEMFHDWNPRTSEREPEGAHKWFSEGFTNFYARRLMYRAGIITLDNYVSDLNHELASAALSPERNADRARIIADYWRSHDVADVPYWRGDLVALVLDGELRRASGGRRGLDDLYRRLVEESDKGAELDGDKLLGLLARETSPAVAATLRHSLVDGASLALDAALLAPCLRLTTVTRPTFELGFDLEAARQKHEIGPVRPESKAARAGVRAGMKVTGWSVERDATKEVELQVRDGDQTRTLRWLPQGELRPVQQFVVADGQACAIL
jgi:predicted metalloprotease with PDZ domain